MIRVNSLFSAGICGKYLVTISGCYYKKRLVILTVIMWFACPHLFTEIYFIKSWTDQVWKWLQLNFQEFSNPVQLAAFLQQLWTILKKSWSKKLLNLLKVFEKYWIPLLGLQKSLKFNTLSAPHCFLWN